MKKLTKEVKTLSRVKEALDIAKICEVFPIVEENVVGIRPNNIGNVNSTFHVEIKEEDGSIHDKYILQKINTYAFKNPDQLMENIVNVTNYIGDQASANGQDPTRETMKVIFTRDGDTYFTHENGTCWRMYTEVEDTYCLNQVENPDQFYKSAKAFGKFQNHLNDFDATSLHETIEKFHDTRDRYAQFEDALEKDPAGRADSVRDEIDFIIAHKEETAYLMDRLEEGILPLRVTHNDTKLNNVLFDNVSDEAIAVIDLDTVMPGLSVHDFGDAVRFGANEAAEDEKDLSKVSLNLELFEAYTKGYFETCGDILTEEEKDDLVWGLKIITLELAIRFLTDYLLGDVYFNTSYEGHNLDRARTQIKLVEDIENKWSELTEIINKYR